MIDWGIYFVSEIIRLKRKRPKEKEHLRRMGVLGLHNPGLIAFRYYFGVARWRVLALPECNALRFKMIIVHALVDGHSARSHYRRHILVGHWRSLHDARYVRAQRWLSRLCGRGLLSRLRHRQLFPSQSPHFIRFVRSGRRNICKVAQKKLN